jgi:hypothetical protein
MRRVTHSPYLSTGRECLDAVCSRTPSLDHTSVRMRRGPNNSAQRSPRSHSRLHIGVGKAQLISCARLREQIPRVWSGVFRSAKTAYHLQVCRYHSKNLADGKLSANLQIRNIAVTAFGRQIIARNSCGLAACTPANRARKRISAQKSSPRMLVKTTTSQLVSQDQSHVTRCC